jgi:hypothetical protein
MLIHPPRRITPIGHVVRHLLGVVLGGLAFVVTLVITLALYSLFKQPPPSNRTGWVMFCVILFGVYALLVDPVQLLVTRFIRRTVLREAPLSSRNDMS